MITYRIKGRISVDDIWRKSERSTAEAIHESSSNGKGTGLSFQRAIGWRTAKRNQTTPHKKHSMNFAQRTALNLKEKKMEIIERNKREPSCTEQYGRLPMIYLEH
jgi:hypothetical protein